MRRNNIANKEKELQKEIREKLESEGLGKNKLHRITITRRESKIYLGWRDNEVSYFNRWDVIK